MEYQAMVTPCAEAGGSTRNLLVTGAYQGKAHGAQVER
jgi:hypothetical protein